MFSPHLTIVIIHTYAVLIVNFFVSHSNNLDATSNRRTNSFMNLLEIRYGSHIATITDMTYRLK